MRSRGRNRIAALAIVAVCGWLLVSARSLLQPSAAQPAAAPSSVSPPGGKVGWLGTASCSGRACHGGLGSAGAKGSEYTTYLLQEDPHTKAFAVLDSDRSRLMVKNLHGKDAQPQTDALCLSCHGPATFAAGKPAADGFSCESCHGPAEKWLEPHTATTWSARTDKEKLGFRPMDRMADRARVCTDCHVGAGNRDVNHDLIAAGHPRLNFEFDTYLANLPPHWQPERDKDRDKAWQIGQAVSAEAALDLLAHRAEPKNDRPWPEFAEYDCFACHHDLKAKSQRQQFGYGDRVPGSLPWSDWYTALPRLLEGGRPAQDGFAGLRVEMSKPLPDRTRVATEAQALADLLHKNVLPRLMADEPHFGSFVRAKDAVAVANWDIAAQMALALQAEYGARKKPDPKVRDELRKLFDLLQFSDNGRFDSPTSFDGKAVAKQIHAVCALLKN